MRTRRRNLPGRLTLGLYNCYDPKQWHEIMRITLARAAPVAVAFDCELATFGFPYAQARARGAKRNDLGLDSPATIADFVEASTSIGDAGGHFRALVEAGRFHVEEFPTAGFPARLGHPVATTPQPAMGKRVGPRDVASQLAAGRDQLLVIGLGPRGLPAAVMEGAVLHLELTGRSISLETSTALGAIPAAIQAHAAHMGGAP